MIFDKLVCISIELLQFGLDLHLNLTIQLNLLMFSNPNNSLWCFLMFKITHYSEIAVIEGLLVDISFKIKKQN